MEPVKRRHTLVLPLSKTAKDFGYNLEVDDYDDVSHDGYSGSAIRSMNLDMPKGMDGVEKVFPWAVGMAMETTERRAIAQAIKHARLEYGLKAALEAIDVGAAEYLDDAGMQVSVPAAIVSVEIKESEDELIVEMLNPEHLINAILVGEGMFGPELSSTEPATDEELSGRFHNLKMYFKVYGVGQPVGELPSHEYGVFDHSLFEEELKFRLGEITVEEAAEALKEAKEVDEDFDIETYAGIISKHTDLSLDAIKQQILSSAQAEVDSWKEILK